MNSVSFFDFSNKALLSWITAFCLMEFPMKYFYTQMIGGKYVQQWYDFSKFDVYNVMIGDLLYVLVGIVITYRVVSYLFKKKNFVKFFLVFSGVQILGDLTFYTIISKILPKSIGGKWINFFRDYGKNAGLWAVVGDNVYILVWSLVAYIIYNRIPTDIKYAIISAFVFILSIISETYKK